VVATRRMHAEHKDAQWSMEGHQEVEQDPLAAMPPVPPKAMFEPPDAAPYNAEARLPAVDSGKVGALSSANERERLQGSLKAASVLLRRLQRSGAATCADTHIHAAPQGGHLR
jgi:hypothetical protein